MRGLWVVALFLTVPGAASAATVDGGVVTRVVGAPGETNALTIVDEGDGVLVSAQAGTLTAAGRCVAVPEGVHCPNPFNFLVSLGDGDDVVHSSSVSLARVDGGPGNDTVVAREGDVLGGEGDDDITASVAIGGAGNDHIVLSDPVFANEISHADGGSGDDTIVGRDGPDSILTGTGTDTVQAGAGDDGITATDGGDAMIDGGDGQDRLFLDGASGVDLDLGDGHHAALETIDGTPYGDHITGSAANEAIFGRRGDDILAGGGGDDRLTGSEGEDRLDGGEGEDRLEGGEQFDRLAGGAGDDRLISGHDLYADRLDCGPGADRAAGDRADAAAGCESVHATARPPFTTVGTRGLRVSADPAYLCPGVRVQLRSAGRELATHREAMVPDDEAILHPQIRPFRIPPGLHRLRVVTSCTGRGAQTETATYRLAPKLRLLRVR
jgi:Ca2+-binding RTX toxin-like protein